MSHSDRDNPSAIEEWPFKFYTEADGTASVGCEDKRLTVANVPATVPGSSHQYRVTTLEPYAFED